MVKAELSRTRQRTRTRLIESTLALMETRGFAAATLDDIAAYSGVTKGAIYSNYRSKGELLWDAARGKQLNLRPQLRPEASTDELAAALAHAVMALIPQAVREAEFHRELAAYVRTDPELQAREAAEQTALFDSWADQLEVAFGNRLAITARQMVLAVQAISRGFLAQAAVSPEEITEAVVTAAFKALVGGATGSGSSRQS